ncbi:MAG: hypothetical protein KAJ19_22805 [Gammaproteobacteria bacterium]|nr:hypothetical protein [Gammaproteobacteria bacterium]
MPSGRVHRGDCLLIAVGAGLLTALTVGPVQGVGIALGALAGVVLTPDLDILESRFGTGKRIALMTLWPIIIAAAMWAAFL